MNWNKRQLDRIRQTNQPLSSSAVAVAEQNPNKVGWGRETREATEKEEKGDSWSQTACQKKKRSEALPQMRHSCKSDSQTLAETLPSFLGWRKLRSLTHTPISLVSLRLLSPQALQNPGIKKRRLYSLSLSFSLISLPSFRLSLRRFFPEAKKQRGAVFCRVEAYAEQHQI